MINVIKQDNGIDFIQMKNDVLEVVVSNYGCTVLKILMKDKDGNIDDVVLGYETIKEYQTYDAYLGALVGRVANRIGKGTFEINGETYHVPINNGPNSLHGGIKGFSYQVFDYVIEEDSLLFTYVSKDGEEGYPGTLTLKVKYTLDNESLIMNYQATTTKDTLINITNHSYFNLSGKKENIYEHELLICADKIACVDGDGLTTGELLDVDSTPFDFRKMTYIKDLIDQAHPQIELGKGYDHPFIFNTQKDQATLYHPKSGRRLVVSTTLPQAQIYSANYLDGRLGKYGHHYNERDGICIETQNMPDAIHIEKEPTTLLKANDKYDETTIYTFDIVKS
ncbi:MAG: aldose epimerase family protein [Coprobacillus sp.]